MNTAKIGMARLILERTGLRVWKNKTLDQMTDDECEECLRYIEQTTNTLYVRYR